MPRSIASASASIVFGSISALEEPGRRAVDEPLELGRAEHRARAELGEHRGAAQAGLAREGAAGAASRRAQPLASARGKERDSESGNDYFGARYYASSMGRFMSPDWSETPEAVPYANLANPQSLNLYSYVGNNPLKGTDPNGHCDIDGEHHGGGWCFLHAIGLTETQHEEANDIRAAFTDWNLVFYDGKGNKKSPGDLSDKEAVDIYNQQFGFSNLDGAEAAAAIPPGLMRMRLLSQAKDPGLKNIINDLYKDTSSFGDGGTADAIEYERATGQQVVACPVICTSEIVSVARKVS